MKNLLTFELQVREMLFFFLFCNFYSILVLSLFRFLLCIQSPDKLLTAERSYEPFEITPVSRFFVLLFFRLFVVRNQEQINFCNI